MKNSKIKKIGKHTRNFRLREQFQQLRFQLPAYFLHIPRREREHLTQNILKSLQEEIKKFIIE